VGTPGIGDVEPARPDAADPVPLTEPSGGTPAVVTEPVRLAEVSAAIATGQGPIAVDTERASGYRYSQRAYLVQVRREGVGTVLVDPVALGDRIDPLIDSAERLNIERFLRVYQRDYPQHFVGFGVDASLETAGREQSPVHTRLLARTHVVNKHDLRQSDSLLLVIQRRRRRLARILRVDTRQSSEPAQETTRKTWIVRWSQRRCQRARVNYESWRLARTRS